MEQSTSGGELARVHVPTVITAAEDFRTLRQQWVTQQCHILTPIADFRALPECYGLMPAQVQVNTDPNAGDVYQDKLFCKEHEFALTKLGLAKVALAAGMTIKTERVDPRTIQNYWEVRATAQFIGIDGTPQSLDATEELDLRDGTDRSLKVMGKERSEAALRSVRAKGLRNCEARAINAVIRQFGLKQKYTRQELEKPFVVLRVVFMPDMSDPEVKRFITERAMGGTAALYPNARALPVAEPEPLGAIGAGAPLPPNEAASAPAVLTVADVTPKSGETDGRPWTVWRVTFSDGRFGGTFNTKLADKANQARIAKTPVRKVAIDESGKNPNLTKLELVTDEEDRPLPLEPVTMDDIKW